MNMAAVDLATPAIADFDFAISRRSTVANDEMIGEAVLHPTNMLVVIIKDSRITLPRAAIVHDDKLPPASFHRRAPDRIDHRTR